MVLRGIEEELSQSDPELAGLFSLFTALADDEQVPGEPVRRRLTPGCHRPRCSRLNHRMARSPSVRAQLARGATG